MAERLASTSASVVAQDETLMRMAVRPCHSVPPPQQMPSCWMRSMTARVFSGVPNDTSTWLITTSFRISKPAARRPAAKRWAWPQVRIDEVRDALATQRSQARPQLGTPRATGHFGRVVHGLTKVALDEIGGGGGEGGPHGGRVPHKDEPAIVAGVGPLVAIGGPGIGGGEIGGVVAVARGGGGQQNQASQNGAAYLILSGLG